MRTRYLRNVPDEVVQRWEKLAAREATSVSSIAIRELAEASRRADNLELLAGLPDLDIGPQAIVESLAAERAER